MEYIGIRYMAMLGYGKKSIGIWMCREEMLRVHHKFGIKVLAVFKIKIKRK